MPDPSLIFTRPIIRGSGYGDWYQNCSVELLGLAIYGNFRHGSFLPCIDRGCQGTVIVAQDLMDDETRNSRRWRLIIARLATCHNTGNDSVRGRMRPWASRSMGLAEGALPSSRRMKAAAVRWAIESGVSFNDALVDWVDRYLDEWGKVAADEGCMAPEDQDAEYLDFVSKLDFLMSGETHDHWR